MKVSLIVDLAGNLQSRARQYAQALTGLSNSGNRAFSGLRNAAASVGRGLDGMGNRYTAMIAGAGITYKATKAVMDSAALDKMLARVANTAGATAQQSRGLRSELFDALQGFAGHESAHWRAALDDPQLFQLVQRVPHGAAAHLIGFAQLAFGGQPLARTVDADRDLRQEMFPAYVVFSGNPFHSKPC